MYPFLRLGWQFFRHRNDPPLGLFDTHESRHVCWPWDLDPWWELNNGRTLTLYDLGRLPLGKRAGLLRALKQNRWGLTVAGSSTRYRRRVRAFEAITMRSRAVGWDARFFYIEQAMFKRDGEAASHVLIRSAVTGRDGIVPPQRLAEALGHDGPPPPLPDWVIAWAEADATRPWPPMHAGHDPAS